MSHDIRTPLTAVCGYVELCEREEMSDTLRSYLSHIRSGNEALTSLSEELLGYSTAVSEKKPDPQMTDIRALLEESIISFAGQLEKRGITPEISLPEGPLYRTVDRYAMSRVFGNIISNAVKYSDGDLSILLTADGTASFSNTSSDLSEVDTAKLFDRFFTVDTARISTGLGLSIAKLLTERSGGSISASYADGRLTITVTFKNSQPV